MMQAVFDKLAAFQRMFTDVSPASVTLEEAAVEADDNLDGIEERFPVHDHRLLVAKVYGLLCKVSEQPGDGLVRREVEEAVALRLDRTAQVIATYEAASVPADANSLRENMVKGFSLYRDGLACFQTFLWYGEYSHAAAALRLIFNGDEHVRCALEDIAARQAEGVHVVL